MLDNYRNAWIDNHRNAQSSSGAKCGPTITKNISDFVVLTQNAPPLLLAAVKPPLMHECGWVNPVKVSTGQSKY